MDPSSGEEPLTPTTYKKRYSSSWFYGQTDTSFPTIEEQVELCRKIASQLVNDENRESKGATMFYKRVKRAPKWVHQSTRFTSGGDDRDPGSMSEDEREQIERMKQRFREESRKPLKLILDPREIISVEKLRRSGTGSFSEHNVVSPDVCHNLVKDLNSPDINKGAQIFLKRKEKSSQWIVEENKASKEIRQIKEKQEREDQHALQNALKQQQQQQSAGSTASRPLYQATIPEPKPRIKLIKSPWEAALQTGNVANAFVNLREDKLMQTVKEAAVKKQFNYHDGDNNLGGLGSTTTSKLTNNCDQLGGTINRKYQYSKDLYLARAPRGWMPNEPRRDVEKRSASVGGFYQQNYYQPGRSCSPLTINGSKPSGEYQPEPASQSQQQPRNQSRAQLSSTTNTTNTMETNLPHFDLLSFASRQPSLPKFRDFNLAPRGFSRAIG